MIDSYRANLGCAATADGGDAADGLDAFADFFRVDASVLRQDVRSAADFAINAVAIRQEDRKSAADGRRIVTDLMPNAVRALRRIARLEATHLARCTKSKASAATQLTETVINQATTLSANLVALMNQIDYVRLPAGGGSDQDRLAVTLIERLARVWTRHTNRSVPGGSTGPFVAFVAAAWVDLKFPEFTNARGEPQSLVDAIGNRVVKFHRREHGAQSRSK